MCKKLQVEMGYSLVILAPGDFKFCAGYQSSHIGKTKSHLPMRINKYLAMEKKFNIFKHLLGNPSCKSLAVSYYHVTYNIQIESTFYSLPEWQGTPCSKQAPYPKFK